MKDTRTIKKGKVVELVPKQLCNGYVVKYGLPLGKRALGKIRVYANDFSKSFNSFNNGISSVREYDGCVKICINNGETKATETEDTLIVIIPYARQLVTTSENIYNKTHGEAVLFMHVGDRVELSQSTKGKRYAYIVSQNKNKLFLIKDNK